MSNFHGMENNGKFHMLITCELRKITAVVITIATTTTTNNKHMWRNTYEHVVAEGKRDNFVGKTVKWQAECTVWYSTAQRLVQGARGVNFIFNSFFLFFFYSFFGSAYLFVHFVVVVVIVKKVRKIVSFIVTILLYRRM